MITKSNTTTPHLNKPLQYGRYLNTHAVAIELDQLEHGLGASLAEGDLDAGAIHLLIDGTRRRLEIRQGAGILGDDTARNFLDEPVTDPQR